MVAWIWAFIWHLPLDLIKWAMAYILNEDGFRDRMHGRDPASLAKKDAVVLGEGDGLGPKEEGKPSVARTSLGRTSLGRTSAGGKPNIGRNSVQVTPQPTTPTHTLLLVAPPKSFGKKPSSSRTAGQGVIRC